MDIVSVPPPPRAMLPQQHVKHGLHVQQRRGFVKSLELEDFPFHVGKDQRYVSDGSLVSFVSNLTGQQKQDVLDSSLLAQLAANKKYDREKDTKNWYKFYTNVMENVGWVLQGFQFNDYHSSQSSFKLSQVTLEILSALVGGDEQIMNVVKATLRWSGQIFRRDRSVRI